MCNFYNNGIIFVINMCFYCHTVVPALDNGEMIWSMIAVAQALRMANLTGLADR